MDLCPNFSPSGLTPEGLLYNSPIARRLLCPCDPMIMHRDVEALARFGDLARDFNVLTAGFGRTAGVVVHQDQR